jgi:signal transduction histidine kinase
MGGVVVDHDCRILFANRFLKDVFQGEHLEGKRCFEVFNDSAEQCPVPVDECPMRAVRNTGMVVRVFHRQKWSGGEKRLMDVMAFPVRHDGETPLVGMIISERHAVEGTKERESLIRVGKMAVIGSMLMYIVHNLNGSLYVMNNYLELLKTISPESRNSEKYLGKMSEVMRYMSGLTKALLDYTRVRKEPGVPEPLTEVMEQVLSLFDSAFIQKGIEVVKEFGSGSTISLERQDALTIFISIIQNSIQAMPDGGMLTVRISGREVTISDTGQGIPEEMLNLLRREENCLNSAGLGLAVTRLILEKAGGRLDIESKIGKGTTVRLIF